MLSVLSSIAAAAGAVHVKRLAAAAAASVACRRRSLLEYTARASSSQVAQQFHCQVCSPILSFCRYEVLRCDECVWLSVCLSVRWYISEIALPTFTKFCTCWCCLWPWLGTPLTALRYVLLVLLITSCFQIAGSHVSSYGNNNVSPECNFQVRNSFCWSTITKYWRF